MRVAYLVFLFLLSLIVIDSCKNDKEENVPVQPSAYRVNLRWNRAYAAETKEMVETGLLWAFTFLGADLPAGSFSQAKSWKGNTIEIDLGRLGFNNQALNAFSKLLPQLRQSDEYRQYNAIDVGRFIMLTLNSSNHYYAITGVSASFSDVRANRISDPVKAAVNKSSVTLTDRLIEVPDSTVKSIQNMVFIAHECEGSIASGTQSVYEYETAELMPNGQFRFAIYDTANRLLPVSDITRTASGKPAKCLWCHEINIQPLFITQTDVPGYYGTDMFNSIVARNTGLLKDYRKGRNSDIDYNRTQDHTYAELLYISFMEPNVERLSIEWNMGVAEATDKLKNLPTHTHAEFPYLGTLYDRKDVDLLSPYPVIKVPESAREKSSYEPDMIK